MTKLGTLALLVLAISGCKKKDDAATGSAATGGSAANMASGAPPDPGPPAGSGSTTGSGSAAGSTAAGSGSGSATAGSGSAAGPNITFGALPSGWEAADGKLETFVAVNESKFPVDNATFHFDYGLDADAAPKDPKAYGAYAGMKVVKDSKVANGHYYETADAFRFVIEAGSKRIVCGGSLYRDKDYNKIPKVRDETIATAKKICLAAKI